MWSLPITLGLLGLAGATLVDRGRVVELNGISYFTGGIPVGQLSGNVSQTETFSASEIPGSDLFPLAVIEAPSPEISAEELLNITTTYDTLDDVFQPAFLQSIYIRVIDSGNHAIGLSDTSNQLSELGTTLLIAPGGFTDNSSSIATALFELDLPKGPYFVSVRTGDIYKAYRLYEDDHLAFWQGVIDDGHDGFVPLPASTQSPLAKSIGVPSRLYYTETEDKPLAGLRLGVKDLFHIKGIATTGGSSAYYNLYGIQNNTAPSVQRLIDLGAVVVVDFHAPFNARGDGYQTPTGSSSGSGAGIGAYGWLDISIGSDTGGSMRGPAGLNGIFGNRPSTGAISLDQVIPLTPIADTAGIFARSGSLWSKVTRLWYPDFASNFTSYPKTLYRPEVNDASAASIGPDVIALIEGFFDGLKAFLEVDLTPANFTQLWAETHGDAPADINELLSMVFGIVASWDQWRLLAIPFYDDYAAKFNGRQPYVNPAPLMVWQWAEANGTDDAYAEALRNVSVFKSWYETEGYGRRDPDSCSEALYVYPWTLGTPAYRDVYFQAPVAGPISFTDQIIAVASGGPEVIVPIGEVQYNSTKSGRTEYLPVTMALRMARGCDHQLANQRQSMAKAITDLHSTAFNMPAFFVHVNFVKQQAAPGDASYFMAGKPHSHNANRVVGMVRTSSTRTKEDFDELATRIESAWDQVVGGDERRQDGRRGKEIDDGGVYAGAFYPREWNDGPGAWQ
ncbi:hypothetical protein CPLU01_11183 [Colletotrichum plurivorum]|uniref:Amidase domain-containing protein n=1 Tax=Colletotrichum plurivorum TaxID=2175906 RepID=A0A8H6K2W9_9PEZI|nr:hypothetical protein CPLU01_11183 [Colletotrichum plurivorum]